MIESKTQTLFGCMVLLFIAACYGWAGVAVDVVFLGIWWMDGSGQ